MRKHTLQRVLAMVLTICMVMGIFVGTVSAADEPEAGFSASATSSVAVASNGHYPVEFQLMNPTNTAYSVTLHKTAGDAEFNYRGTSADNGAVTVAANTDTLVSGYLTFSDAKKQNKTDVTVEIRSGSTVLDTVTIDIIDGTAAAPGAPHVIRALSFDFAVSTQNWNGTLDNGALKIASGKEATYGNKLELIPGHLYRLSFDAKGTSNAGVMARVTDYDENGTELSVPMSLNSRTALTTAYKSYEHRFVANSADLNTYTSSVLSFRSVTGTVYIDNVVLVDCGNALGNQVENPGFEDPLHSNGYSINSQWDTMIHLEAANAGYGWAPYEGKECLSAVRQNNDAPRFRPWGAYNTADEVTITFWSKYIAKDTSGLPEILQAKVHIWEYDETETQINDKVIGTFDLTDTDWESCDVNYQKPADVSSFRFAIEIYSNVEWFRGTLFDHFSLRSTKAAKDVTAEQIAAAAPIAEIKALPQLPSMAAPVATRFYFGTVTPAHGSLNIQNAEVAYDNGYAIDLFTMTKPADLPADAKPTVTYNGATAAYVDGKTYKVPVTTTSGTYAFNWTEKSTQKVNFSHTDTILLVNSPKSLAAAMKLGFAMKLSADVPVSGELDVTGLTCGEYKLLLSADSAVTGASLSDVTAPAGYEAVMNDGVITVEKIVEGKIFNAGRSLSLEGKIYINQYVGVTGFKDVDIAKNGGLLIWNSPLSEDEATYENAEIVKKGLFYDDGMYGQRTDGIAVKEYADELYLRVYIRGNYGEYYYSPLMEYSVQDYCEGRLANSKNEDMKHLAASMLHYGAAAQLYFNYNTDDLANAAIEENWPAYIWHDYLIDPLKKVYSDMKGTGDVQNTGKSLSLDDAIAVNYYFETTGKWDVKQAELLVWDGVTAKLTEANATSRSTMKKNDAEWIGVSPEFVAKEMGKTIFAAAKFTDTDDNVHYSDIIPYSPEAYAEGRIANSTNPKMVDLAKKMVIYGEFAAIYFGVSDSIVRPEQPVVTPPPAEDEEEEDEPVAEHPTIATPDDVPYGDYLVYDGLPQAHIMLPENATELEVYAAEELQTHTKLVSGATLPINYVDPANRAFEAYAEPATLTAATKGYYSVGITLKNPTDDVLELTLRQKTDAEEREPVLTIRGDNANDGKLTMDPYSQIVVHGQFTVEDANAYGYSVVEVEILSGDTVIDTVPIGFSGHGNVLANGDFEAGQTGWTGAAVDVDVNYNGSSSLKIAGHAAAETAKTMQMVSGQLYYMSFWAKADYLDAEIYAVIADMDADGNALKTPMSLNTRASVRKGSWTFCEFYFTANTTLDADYAASVLKLVNDGSGNIWVDDLVLLSTGAVPADEIENGKFEKYYPDGGNQKFKPWSTYTSCYAEYEDNYEGEIAMGVNNNQEYLGYTLLRPEKTGGTYGMSFWAKAKKDGTQIRFDYLHLVQGAEYSKASQTVTLSDQWERYVVMLDIPQIEEGVKYNGFYTNYEVFGDLILDLVQVQDMSEAIALRNELGLGESGASMVYEADFETGADGWNAAADTTGHNSTASLKIAGKKTAELDETMKLRAGYLYRLGFWAKADAADTVLYTKVSDFDTAGNALTTPMTVNTRTTLTTGWKYYEYRFTANVSGDILYNNSKLALSSTTAGNVWIDDISLVDCGTAPMNIMANGDFETYYPGGYADMGANAYRYKFHPWMFYICDELETAEVYTGAQAVRLTAENAGHALASPFRTPTELVPGKTYTMTYWARLAPGEDYAETQYIFDPYANGQPYAAATKSWTHVLTGSWERYEMQFTVPVVTELPYNGAYMPFKYYLGEVLMDQVILMDTDVANDLVIEENQNTDEPAPDEEMPERPEILPPTRNGLTIFISTSESYPALEKNFREDLDWIGETDGFAIRQRGGTIYIFGTEARGALNGVYDFIEENLGVIWFRANDTAYDPMETVKPAVIDYREKSPFELRGWHNTGSGASGEQHSDWATDVMYSRNKLNTRTAEIQNYEIWEKWTTIGLEPAFHGHNVAWWITTSPIYDPNCYEYWNTDKEGNFITENFDDAITYQINFYSEKSVEATVASVRKFLNDNPFFKTVMIGINDDGYTTTLPWSELPFEYEPGKFVYPGDYNYHSTVFYTYLNKIAVQIKESHPDVTLETFAYNFTEPAPACDIEDNILIQFAPLKENLKEPYFTTKEDPNNAIYRNMLEWSEKTDNITFYNYYGTFLAMYWFDRPIAYRIQQDMQYYAEQGFTGVTPEGTTDYGPEANNWAMNQMTYWIYAKLAWNPYEDVDELKTYFCNKVFGAKAGPYMKEYYDYIQTAWDENDGIIHFTTMTADYLNMFILNSGYVLEMQEALEKADKAAEGVYADRLKYIKDTFDGVVMASSNLKTEDASALHTTAGKDTVLNTPDFTSDIWKDTQRLENFYENGFLEKIPGAATYARLLWDEKNFYVGYEMYDDTIENIKTSVSMDAANSWWNGKSDDVETFITLDPTKESYYFFASNPSDMNFRWEFSNGYRRHVPGNAGWEFKTYFVNEEGTENDKWIVIQAISWDVLGLEGEATKDTEVLAYFYRMYISEENEQQQIAWNGALVWSPKSLRPIELRTEPYVAPEAPDSPDIDSPPDIYIPPEG